MLSFLDGMQRVLMFVDKLDNLNDEVVGFKEIKGDEFVLNLESLGLSLVDDKNQLEILYMSITRFEGIFFLLISFYPEFIKLIAKVQIIPYLTSKIRFLKKVYDFINIL